ncbi:hypothetical protein EYF80_005223 [Liparis tanakae]|uniref:Uncharacterized protein n=1 Tax=Liparis tanakae TaxID=230148 RepID=A0A4Z2J4U8_9TELE|nr:hypothetical protein EYF80_005223 [Liparis tanakae]
MEMDGTPMPCCDGNKIRNGSSSSSWWMNWANAFIRLALPPTQTNYGKQRKGTSDFGVLAFEILKSPKIIKLDFDHFTNLKISKHFWKIVSLGAQAEVVENILLHGVQVLCIKQSAPEGQEHDQGLGPGPDTAVKTEPL